MLAASKPSIYVTGPGVGAIRLTIDSQKGESNGVKWEVVSGRLSLTSSNGPISIDMSSLQKKSLASALGFTEQQSPQTSITGTLVGGFGLNAMGLTDGKPVTTSVTSPKDLTTSLLSALKPKLYLTKPSSGNQVFELTIDAPTGTKNGISWSTSDGKLSLASDDINMAFDPAHSSEAAALGFDPANWGNKISATASVSKALLESLPTASQPEVSVVTGAGANQRLYSVKIGSTSGYDSTSGVSWKLLNGKLSFITGDTAIRLVGASEGARVAARTIGFNGTDLNLNIESTITSANKLTPSLLSVLKPTLQVKGDQIGTHLMTIDRPNGTFNGVTWSMFEGKLSLTSSDKTLRVDAGTLETKAKADALGFTDPAATTYPVTAKDTVYKSMVTAGSGLQLTLSTIEMGDIPITLDTLPGSDPDSGVSWSYNDQTDKLTFSSIYSSFNVKVSSSGIQTAQALGFLGAGLDNKIEAARLSLTSTGADRVQALADVGATVSHVGQAVRIDGGVPEDLVVYVQNPNGSRRIAGKLDIAPAPPPPIRPDLQIRILADGKLEISDPATGASLATRSWQQDVPVNYLGMSFTIHGAANEGDLYTIRNDSTRTSDNRNALRIAELATTSIFGKGQGSFQEVYAGVTSRLGSTVQATNTRAGATAQAAADLKAAYEGKTGVNLDKEAADLIRYQQAYQAAAQIIMAAREMFATILKSF